VFWRAALDALRNNPSTRRAERLAEAALADFRKRRSLIQILQAKNHL